MEAILVPVLQKLGSLIASEGEFLSKVTDDVDWLRDELRSMRSFLQGAEEACADDDQATSTVDQIRDAVYDSEDIIDIFDLERSRPRFSLCSRFFFLVKSQHEIGSRIKDIRSRLNEISRRRTQYKFDNLHGVELSNKYWLHGLLASSPLVPDGDLVGVDQDFEQLLGWVLAGGPELSVISLAGMGGVGKTTLIKKVYKHGEVERHFNRSAWIYVSQSIQLRELFSEMAKGLMEIPSSEVNALSERQLQERLLSSLEETRYLLVFDDIWDMSLWDAIKLVLPRNKHGSRVIITTRNTGVASSVVDVKSYVHLLRPLSLEESRALFFKKAFAARDAQCCCPQELEEAAEGIVRKCGGLPLAVVTVGGMMSRKERSLLEWRRVHDSVYKDLWNDNNDGVWRALLLSYKDLPYSLRSCFLLCSVLPHDSEISRKRLIRLWAAEGFMNEERGEVVEDVAEKYLMELVNRSMIQVSKMGISGRVKACRVHDLLHQLAISISHKENFSTVYDNCRTAEIQKKARRISLHKNYSNSECYKGMQRIRSLLVFGMSEPFCFSTHHMTRDFRLLRVLDLEDACLKKLPREVGDLIHLRYLGLKGTRIMKLPKSLKNLHNMQTLDIRKTHLRKLSFGLKSLKQLRHLEMEQVGQSIKAPQGVSYLERLQVVTGLQANGTIVHEIGKLTQLRKLGIEGLRAEDAVHLCSSINNVANLSSLSIFSGDEPNPLDLSSLTPPSSLQKLHLAGYLERLPDWFCTLRSLAKLRLGLSRLSVDPLPILKELPSLIFLQLYEAYDGKMLRCSNPGFNKLKILVLTGLDELEEWEVEEGAMPCIQELWIMSCSKLKTIPSGFEFLTTLRNLRLVSMPENFIRRVSLTSGGEDYIRVRHVPSIQVLNG